MRFGRDNSADPKVSKGIGVVLICIKGDLRTMYIISDSDPMVDHCADRPSSILLSRLEDSVYFTDTPIADGTPNLHYL
jgi:hypothetical protein